MLCATAGLCACSTSGSLLGGQSSWGLPLKCSHAAGLLQEPWSAWSHRRCRGHSLSELWQGTSQSRGQGHTEWCLEEPALFSCSAGPGEGLVLVKILPQVRSSAAAGAPGALLGDHSMLRDQQHSHASPLLSTVWSCLCQASSMPSSPFLTGWPCHLVPCSAAQVLSTLGCPAGRLTVLHPCSS